MEFGRATLNEKLHLRSQVVSGGAVGPGSIYEYADYNGSKRISHSEDDRSGSKRSGSVVFHLSPNKLYALKNIAYNSSRSTNYFLSTFGEEPTLFDTEDDFEAERARVYPLGKIASDEADERAAQMHESIMVDGNPELVHIFEVVFAHIKKDARGRELSMKPTISGLSCDGYGNKATYVESKWLDREPYTFPNPIGGWRSTSSRPRYYHLVCLGRGQYYVSASDGWKPTIHDARCFWESQNKLDVFVSALKSELERKRPASKPKLKLVTDTSDETKPR